MYTPSRTMHTPPGGPTFAVEEAPRRPTSRFVCQCVQTLVGWATALLLPSRREKPPYVLRLLALVLLANAMLPGSPLGLSDRDGRLTAIEIQTNAVGGVGGSDAPTLEPMQMTDADMHVLDMTGDDRLDTSGQPVSDTTTSDFVNRPDPDRAHAPCPAPGSLGMPCVCVPQWTDRPLQM